MKFALGCLPILLELFAVSGLVVADAKEDTTSSALIRPDGTVVIVDDGRYPDEEVLLAADAGGVPSGKVEIVTSVAAISSLSDDEIDPDLEEWAERATGGEIKRPRYNRRLKSKSKKKLKVAIGLITSGADRCKKEPYISDKKRAQFPTIVDAYRCNSCHPLVPTFICGKCCQHGFKEFSGRCWGPPHESFCPGGYKKELICNKCEPDPYPPTGPGGIVQQAYDESVEAECKESEECFDAQKTEDVGVQSVNLGCPSGFVCADSYHECQKWENTDCSNFQPTIFTEACGGIVHHLCGISDDACRDAVSQSFPLIHGPSQLILLMLSLTLTLPSCY